MRIIDNLKIVTILIFVKLKLAQFLLIISFYELRLPFLF